MKTIIIFMEWFLIKYLWRVEISRPNVDFLLNDAMSVDFIPACSFTNASNYVTPRSLDGNNINQQLSGR